MNTELKKEVIASELAASTALLQPFFTNMQIDQRVADRVFDVIGLALRTALSKIELHELTELIAHIEARETKLQEE